MNRSAKLPFEVGKTDNFFDRLGDYVGDVFYDILPEHGLEERDEQIYMAFQLEQAFKNKHTIFAEAGVGTGKTLVYLIYAICYARYIGKPAIISCADETLIEQLVKEGGDIEKLEKMLDLEIDVRLAKARENYVCMKKLDPLASQTKNEAILRVHDAIPDFVFDAGGVSMQSFHRYGDRREYPWVSDEEWNQIAWDPMQQCSTCDFRHRSGQTLNRDYYRQSKDLIICSHDFYMEHIWTKESRIREGQRPLLPEASAVIFDEGHLLEFAAQKGLTYRFNYDSLTNILTGYMGQDVREESLLLVEDILELHDAWFQELELAAFPVAGSNRQDIEWSDDLIRAAKKLSKLVEQLLEQLVFDAEMFTMEEYYTKIIEEYLEFFSYGLSILLKEDGGITWLEEDATTTSLVVMPRLVEDVLKQEVFSQRIPFIFSSATLAEGKDFSYTAKSLGIEQYDAFSVDSPFNYEEKMQLNLHVEAELESKWQKIGEQLEENHGSSLLLFSSKDEMEQFRYWANQTTFSFPLLFEGDNEISQMIREFQLNRGSVFCSHHLWEGLDIPGEALTQVIISSLPFPPKDPVFRAKRNHAEDPEKEVDIPYMLLRLRQGMGRLIRTTADEGSIQLWVKEKQWQKYEGDLVKVLPVPYEIKEK